MTPPIYLVEILLPKESGNGEPIRQSWFEALLKELTREFGGVTSFVRSPAQGLWRKGSETQRDDIAVIQVMTGRLLPEFWRSLRVRLERDLSQEKIIIRAQEIITL